MVTPSTQPIPTSAGPQPAGQVPTYGAAGIFTGYANPPTTPTVPATPTPPVTPKITPTTPTTTPVVTPTTPPANGGQSGIVSSQNPTGQIYPNQNNGSISPTPQQSPATSTPSPTYYTSSGQAYTVDQHGNVTYTNPTTGQGGTSTGNSDVDALQKSYDDQAAAAQTFSTAVTNIENGTTPLNPGEQAQVDGLKQQFQQLIDTQNLVNTGATGTANIRGYQGGAAEYDPTFQAKTVGSVVSAGAQKISTLQTEEASAVAQLTQSLQNNDIANLKTAWDALTAAQEATQAGLKTVIADTQGAINDAHIASVLSSGVTDPTDILKTLQSQGYTDISSADIAKTIANLSPDAADIYDVQKTAAANGADSDTLALIGKATSKNQALQIAAQGNVANSTVMDLSTKYPDAGIVPGDSIGQANAKVMNSPSYTLAQKSAALDVAYKQAEIAKDNAATAANGDLTTNAQGGAIGTTGSPTVDATVDGYATDIVPGTGGLTQAAIDQDALATALGQPLPVPLGLSSTGAGGLKRTAINNRMAELNAGGNVAANKTVLSANSKALATQVGYLNTVQRAFNTANDTLNSLTSWMSENGINPSNFPDINSFHNYLNSKGIDPGAAGGYNAQIATLRQEYSQVLAKGGVRSASTDAEAAQLIPDGLSPSQLETVAQRIQVDGQNAVNDAQSQVSSVQNKINSIVQGTPDLTNFTNGGTVAPDSTSNGIDLNNYNH